MQTLMMSLKTRFYFLLRRFYAVKKQVDLTHCLNEDIRIDEIQLLCERVDSLLKKIMRISEKLSEEERYTLANEYRYFFGEDYKNPFVDEG